ncbi:MAG: permease-like cell division protein FtsX [Bacteroidales bacterium]|nr:permease-like cell division protein FtsX [Bacteroidales bacterium]
MNRQKKISATRVFNSRFTSTISISLVLFLIGIMLVLGFIAKDLSIYVRENVSMSVIVDDQMKLPDVKMFQKRLETSPYVKSAQYIDKETALKQLVKDLGENPEDLLGYNPLLASFDIYLNADYANTDSMAKFEKVLKQNKDVQDVIYRKDLIHLINENVQRISIILLALAILLTLISYSLIRNTVRLLIYSKRFLIRTMQLVGANGNFIRKPFLLENLWSGIIAAFVAMGLLYGSLYYAEQKMAGAIQIIDIKTLIFVFFAMFFFGVIIILLATWLAVNRYLKMNTSDLYYV